MYTKQMQGQHVQSIMPMHTGQPQNLQQQQQQQQVQQQVYPQQNYSQQMGALPPQNQMYNSQTVGNTNPLPPVNAQGSPLGEPLQTVQG
jgi:hypothetical protein